jgi:hypothetical protein
MDWIVTIVVFIVFAAYLVIREEPTKDKSGDYHGGSRTGRGALWLIFPPAGLWRSIHHGKEKRNQRLIDEIRKTKP